MKTSSIRDKIRLANNFVTSKHNDSQDLPDINGPPKPSHNRNLSNQRPEVADKKVEIIPAKEEKARNIVKRD